MACRTTGTYRVVDLPQRSAEARVRVEKELRDRGYKITNTSTVRGRVKITAVWLQSASRKPVPKKPPTSKKPAASKQPATPSAKRPAPSPISGRTLTAILHPRKTGTRVLLHTDKRGRLARVFAKSAPRDYKVAFGLNGKRLLWEAHAESGYRYAPGYGSALAIEAGARIGYRVIQFGGGIDRPAPQVSVGVAVGLGGGGSTTDKYGYALPSLTLSYLIRRTVEPIPGKEIPIGPEFSIDLHAVGLLGIHRASLEGQLVLRYSDIFGVYVGAGYQWLPTRGTTFTAGLYLSTLGAYVAALIVALAASN